jgi:hypothetical protein
VFVGTSGNKAQVQQRDATNVATALLRGKDLSAPYRFKPSRSADTFTASASIDSVRWSPQGQRVVIAMTQQCAGIAAASRDASFERTVVSQVPGLQSGDPRPAASTRIARNANGH